MRNVEARRRLVVSGLTVLALGWSAACGGDDKPSGGGGGSGKSEGATVAKNNGCVACHGDGGTGGTGPAWVDLVGSTVELADGTEVVADEDYIRRSITDPSAQVVAGFSVQMPEIDLSDADVDALVAYITTLTPD